LWSICKVYTFSCKLCNCTFHSVFTGCRKVCSTWSLLLLSGLGVPKKPDKNSQNDAEAQGPRLCDEGPPLKMAKLFSPDSILPALHPLPFCGFHPHSMLPFCWLSKAQNEMKLNVLTSDTPTNANHTVKKYSSFSAVIQNHFPLQSKNVRQNNA